MALTAEEGLGIKVEPPRKTLATRVVETNKEEAKDGSGSSSWCRGERLKAQGSSLGTLSIDRQGGHALRAEESHPDETGRSRWQAGTSSA
ncbi:hypothetical protein SPBR_06298 [Sporothrix brasiliensis 5110]|uniref:Uncharacterized protein n=1 Tax=Sporothrix brasiliensis 5110 TaxID=1398154 RepID=A0A0C2J4I1_9PEZI|nr:uncharacterized protein SPBR_06298 [Sporothrix brasiliensis 5110]KIH93930.1 hypothetical protein SPBR_06298 [Sporothrix brasiliensis 5110]